jgi:hypothetical protein
LRNQLFFELFRRSNVFLILLALDFAFWGFWGHGSAFGWCLARIIFGIDGRGCNVSGLVAHTERCSLVVVHGKTFFGETRKLVLNLVYENRTVKIFTAPKSNL